MSLKESMQRVGASIVKVESGKDKAVLYLRLEDGSFDSWRSCIEELLLSQTAEWSADVSKYFFAGGGVVKYLWRIIFSGDTKQGAAALARAAHRSRVQTVELGSQPLVGRKEYPFDPLSGKIAGAYSEKQGNQLIASVTRNQ